MAFVFFRELGPAMWGWSMLRWLAVFMGFVGFLLPGTLAAQTADKRLATLMAPQPVPDIWLGRADAPVTLIEYASLNCPHCADFHGKELPALKAKYIDTGKLRFVLRDWPTNDRALQAAVIARCAGSRRGEIIDALFAHVREWGGFNSGPEPMFEVLQAAGMARAEIDACLQQRALFDAINAVKDKAPLLSTVPAFFVNGVAYGQTLPADAIDKALPREMVAQAVMPARTPAASAFKVLDACDRVAAADAGLRESLRVADEQIAALATASLNLAARDRAFLNACRALNGKVAEGPKMDTFRVRSFEVGIQNGKVFDLASALRAGLKTEPLASIGRNAADPEREDCAFTLSTIGADVLKQAESLLNFTPVDCELKGKP
jgi:protein-disulfide isomerase